MAKSLKVYLEKERKESFQAPLNNIVKADRTEQQKEKMQPFQIED